MRRFVFLLLVFLPLPFRVMGQVEAGAVESGKMIREVCQAAGKIKSLQCDFRQTKQLSLLKTAMVSEGKMYYKGGSLLRWEYVKPYTYTFVLNGDKVMLKSPGKTDVIDVKSSRMFQQIARIMMNSITGNSLTDTKSFKVTMYVDGKEWVAKLVPQQKELAQVFSCVYLHVNPEQQMVSAVELVEKGGDKTTIELRNVKKNGDVNSSLFVVGK